mmetsp:Transcript_66488/g.177932  ORF Transcript_66488/g.177932 Transcript_66488/m.177932 type:complete len:126 (+) Transcript_66488:687-1064(+)
MSPKRTMNGFVLYFFINQAMPSRAMEPPPHSLLILPNSVLPSDLGQLHASLHFRPSFPVHRTLRTPNNRSSAKTHMHTNVQTHIHEDTQDTWAILQQRNVTIRTNPFGSFHAHAASCQCAPFAAA